MFLKKKSYNVFTKSLPYEKRMAMTHFPTEKKEIEVIKPVVTQDEVLPKRSHSTKKNNNEQENKN